MRLEPYRFDGGTAVVTGAACGIGAGLAAALADRGSNLALVDRDEAGLHAVAEDIPQRDRPARAAGPVSYAVTPGAVGSEGHSPST